MVQTPEMGIFSGGVEVSQWMSSGRIILPG